MNPGLIIQEQGQGLVAWYRLNVSYSNICLALLVTLTHKRKNLISSDFSIVICIIFVLFLDLNYCHSPNKIKKFSHESNTVKTLRTLFE